MGGALIVGILLAALAVRLDGTPIMNAHHQMQLTRGLVIGQLISYAPILAIALTLLPSAACRSLSALGLRAPRFRDIGIGIIGALAMYVVAGLAAVLQAKLFHIAGKQQAVALFSTTHDETLILGMVAIAVFFAPFVEELVFRGFFFNALLRRMPVGFAIALDGIIFGAAHFDPNASFPLMCGGMVLAAVYYRTGSLAASMFTHGTFNFISVVLVLASGGKLS